MFNKSLIGIAVAFGFVGNAYAVQDTKAFGWQGKVNYVINADVQVPTDQAGRSRYIVELFEKPAAIHAAGMIEESRNSRISPQSNKIAHKPAFTMANTLRTPELESYSQKITRHQNIFQRAASEAVGRSLQASMNFTVAFNGMVLDLTAEEARQLLSVPGVVRVMKEVPIELKTDAGPGLIGADKIWDSTATGLSAKGEGIVIGVMDTGVNTDSRSFAVKGDDDYSVVNPLGSGNFLGDCAADASLCNDKLIGVYSFTEVTDLYDGIRPANGEDYNGHGSHTASTAAGNILNDVSVLVPGSYTQVSDGTDSGTVLPKMSGVAPHANVISYQVCGQSGCYPSLSVASVEQAIKDGVDVLNYSIGPTGGTQTDPWNSPVHSAFLAARESGIVVAMAAGNDGPSASTVGNIAPWALSVAATTHERTWSHDVTGSDNAGIAAPVVEGVADVFTDRGETNALLVETEVVYAGDYQDMYGNSMALCDQRVGYRDPVRSIFTGKIVVCDRGEVPLTEKVMNTWMAAGVVIVSTSESSQNMASVRYSLPSVLLNKMDGERLLSWMGNADAPKLSIGAAIAKYAASGADILAGFSSRGPYYPLPELMVPHISAPGVDIYAAYSDEQPFTPGYAASPADFAFLSGTSMASPHVAGAAALLRQLHPDWTAAEIQSAMMLTANSIVRKEDGVTAADIFDTGSGRLQVDKAANASLVMDVSIDAYKAANPNQGGDVRLLNMPVLTDAKCAYSCSWERTFRATQSGSWSVESQGIANGLSIAASPSSFTMDVDEEITITVTASASLRVGEDWSFLRVDIVPSDNSPVLSMPMAIKPLLADVPSVVSQDYLWSKGDLTLPGLRFRYPDDLLLNVSPLERAKTYILEVAEDSNNRSPFDDLEDGTALQFIDVPEGASDLRVIVGESTAKDVDIFIGLDSNLDNKPEFIELAYACATQANVGESCNFDAGSGRYWVMVHNFEGSGVDKDSVRLDILMKPNDTSLKAYVDIEDSNVSPYDETSIALNWEGDMSEGIYYGEMEIFDRTSGTGARMLSKTDLVINRKKPTVNVSVVNAEFSHGQNAALALTLPGNPTAETLTYTVSFDIDASITLADAALSNLDLAMAANSSEAELSHSSTDVSLTLPPKSSSQNLVVSLQQATAKTGEFDVDVSVESSKLGFDVEIEKLTVKNSNEAPSLNVPTVVSGDMGTEFELKMDASDANADQLSYLIVQESGPFIGVEHDGGEQAMLVLPDVDKDTNATFSISVTDGELTQVSEMKVEIMHVEQDSDDGGSLGWLTLLLMMIGLRRKVVCQ